MCACVCMCVCVCMCNVCVCVCMCNTYVWVNGCVRGVECVIRPFNIPTPPTVDMVSECLYTY